MTDDYFPEMEKKGNCDGCRKPFYLNQDIFLIKFDVPKEGLNKLLGQDEKIRLCRQCFAGVKKVIEQKVFAGA